MKRPIKLLLPICSIAIFIFLKINPENPREEYERYLKNHEYLNRNTEEIALLKKQDRPDEAWELNFLLTMDPKTKQPEPSRLLKTYSELKVRSNERIAAPGQDISPWVERGPNNVGGRTRAIAFDPSTENKVWAGGVSGGLWFNNNITDGESSWQAVDDFWDNLAITCIAFDPNNSSNIYVGTGEGWNNIDAVRGAGVWKSEDSGTTWNQLNATRDFFYVNDLVVRDESSGSEDGVLYVASSDSFNNGSFGGTDGVFYSSDGGQTFNSVTTFTPKDLSIGAGNRIWCGTEDGRILHSDNGSDWTESHSSGLDRVAIAASPSNENYIYAVIADGSVVGSMIFSDDNGANWSPANEPADVDEGIPDDDFSRGQAWYDLVIAVDPNDENTVITGAIDLFRSTDNGTNWQQISKWSNNNDLNDLNCSLVHADQHAIVFKGEGFSEVIVGNDGGVYYSADLTNAATQGAIFARNNNYNVTQFYSCAIHPELGEEFFLAGAQDNGSHRFNESGINSTTEVNGGDGGFCFIDQTDPTFQITSYVRNVYDLSTNGGNTFFNNLQNDQNTGLFINPADYDDNLDVLYSSRDESSINRISGVTNTPAVDNFAVSLGSTASHLRVSPYTTSSTTLFVGTLSGRLFKIENAESGSPSPTEITGGSFPSGSISCVELGADENEVLVTFSNYGVSSIWYTNDGGANWTAKEGDLPDMPVRWVLFNPNALTEVILATELGIWRTPNIGTSTPSWFSSNSGLSNVRVDMLQLRDSDQEVIAATHGRGLFSSNGFRVEAPPAVDFTADINYSCSNSLDVNFTDLTTSFPTASSYAWEFPGGTPSSSNSQTPPTVTYSSPGNYDVSLTVTNSEGSSTETKSGYVSVNSGINLPFQEGFESTTFPPECWMISTGLNGLGTGASWTRNTTNVNSGAGSAYSIFENVGGTENAEDWLITPQINLSGHLKSSLTFFAREAYSGTFGSQYHVRVSGLSQTDLSSFINVATFTEDDFEFGFTQFTVDLSDFDNQNIFIAFVHEQNDGDDWILDDIEITGTSLDIAASNGLDFCEDEGSVLSTLEDSEFEYQWKLDGQNINGANNSSFTPSESGTYTVEATFDNATVETPEVDVTIQPIPAINSISSSQVICQTEVATLTIDATGSNLTFQWRLEDVDLTDDDRISGATTASLVISDVSTSDAGNYTCYLTNGDCDTISELVTISVNDLTAITAQPSDMEMFVGESATFEVSASGNNLTYQWFLGTTELVDSDKISGTTSSTLSINTLELSDAGDYSVVIESECQIVLTSETANLTVEVPTSVESLAQRVSIYPNPAHETLWIKPDGSIDFEYSLFSASGKKLLEGRKTNSHDGTSINTTELDAGIYILVILSDEKKITRQIAIK